ncbi:chitinase-like protein 3 [Drosophila pseudoobscura]|uniref:Chitinase-like protein 3 n=1 Tax=Drosophila pseudoobscura pseudoobscura TaxID=46245 RepID=A0A6I8V579_DROPS|nr:chitinase-like protein 3 [Drosophila pseudoobscura]
MWSLNCAFVLMIFMIYGCAAKDFKIFCQYDVGSYYYKNSSKFFSWNIDLRLCTHLVYGTGVGVDGETGDVTITDKYLLVENDMLNVAHRLKRDNVKKVMFTIGGWLEESSDFSKMAADARKRDRFFTSLVEFMYEWRFDGVQIDWRYPTQRGGKPEDRKNFILLLEELKIICQEHQFILMVAVLGRTDKSTLEWYDIPKLVQYVHYINLMHHDNRDPYQMHLSYNAPLSGVNSVIESVKLWKQLGKAPAKLILNIPLFVRSYIMENDKTTVGSPCKGPGLKTPLTREPGFMTYGEWCMYASSWTQKFDEQAQVPYAYKGNHWISYENARSIWAKMHLLKSNNLGGAMAWTIDSDDYHGKCGESHSLGRVILTALGDVSILAPEEPTTESMGLCPKNGFFRQLWDCQLYYECRNGERIDYECLEGYYFDESRIECMPKAMVKCDQNFVTWRPGQPLYNFENMPVNLKIVE